EFSRALFRSVVVRRTSARPMNGYLLDTNIVTAYLKRHPGVRQRIRAAERAGRPVRLNAVSYYETKRGLLAIGAHKQLVAFERLWRVLGIVIACCLLVGSEAA